MEGGASPEKATPRCGEARGGKAGWPCPTGGGEEAGASELSQEEEEEEARMMVAGPPQSVVCYSDSSWALIRCAFFPTAFPIMSLFQSSFPFHFSFHPQEHIINPCQGP